MAEPVAYMERTRAWYLALGYDNPYEWAHFDTVPFTPLVGPLSDYRVGIVTTAAPYQPGKGDQGPGAAYNGAAKFFDVWTLPATPAPDVRISHIAYDRTHTTAEDPRTWLPLEALRATALDGRIGELGPNVYGFPTRRSQRDTTDRDAPALLERLREDDVHAAILVANCPVCHQSLGIAARHLESAGIATVVMGCARDIVEHCGVPRFVFSDFPLGNAAGKPHDAASQAQTLDLALTALSTARTPATTIVSPQIWSRDDTWKEDYCNPERVSPEELARRRAEFDAAKKAARG